MAKLFSTIVMVALFSGLLTSQAYSGWNPLAKEKPEDQEINGKAAQAIADFKNKDPGMKVFFREAYGYAIFPTVGKAGIGIGGAFGKGEVYRQGKLLGSTSLTQLSIGFQLGGQAYSEIIFFKDKKALERFTAGNFEFGAQVSAVAVTAGASADAAYNNGVAIFTMAKGGLMYEASVGGQKFSFTPK
jgi:lipid-binding SYLF domain-containing protein